MVATLQEELHSAMERRSLRSVVIGRSVTACPSGGSAWRNLQNLRALATLGPVAAFSLTSSASEGKQVSPEEAAEWTHLRLDEERRGSTARWRWLFKPGGHPVMNRWFGAEAFLRFSKQVEQWRPQLVVCEELWVFHWVEALARGSWLVILDEHNIEARIRRLIEQGRPFTPSLQGLRVALRQRLLERRVRVAEERAIRSADQVWVCSAKDAEGLREEFGTIDDIHVVPNTIDLDYYSPVRNGEVEPALGEPGPNDGLTLIFVGAGSYEPNRRAALWLIRELFPEIRRRVERARLLIVGSDPRGTLLQAAMGSEGVIVTGRVDDVRPYLASANLAVVPLREGSGTRLKLCEAFACGIPVVCTPQAAEGLNVVDGEHLRLAELGGAIVEAVCDLWSDRPRAERMAEQALDLVRTRFSLPASRAAVRAALESLVERHGTG
jgi:glycosyltransferase involved in cell wall biosynthesis